MEWPRPSPPYPWDAWATRIWISHRRCCSSPPTTPATSPARPLVWTAGRFYTPDEVSTASNAIPVNTKQPTTTNRKQEKGLGPMKILGLDHIAFVVRDIE